MQFICHLISMFTTFCKFLLKFIENYLMNKLFTHSVFGSSLVVIGNYSELNPKGCGFTRLSSKVDNNCFEWHKQVIPNLRKGKDVSLGDAPWMALIISSGFIVRTCSGSLIANQWILTAAHCVHDLIHP